MPYYDLQLVTNTQDANLIDPWDIVKWDCSLYVSNNVTGKITRYCADGRITSTVINAPPRSSGLTGLVYNCTKLFVVFDNGKRASADLISCTEEGSLVAYSKDVDEANAFEVYRFPLSNFKGMMMLNKYLYVADFYHGNIKVIDGNWNLQEGYPFLDPNLPEGYAPFNITHVCGKIYVAYALRGDDNRPVFGTGLGFVSIFDEKGNFIKRFASQGRLNAPWALSYIKRSRSCCCKCSCYHKCYILIGNFGDGTINEYDENGNWIRTLEGSNGNITLPGLWAIKNIDCNLYYVAGGHEGRTGVLGKLY